MLFSTCVIIRYERYTEISRQSRLGSFSFLSSIVSRNIWAYVSAMLRRESLAQEGSEHCHRHHGLTSVKSERYRRKLASPLC
jgi:hypothetical protein